MEFAHVELEEAEGFQSFSGAVGHAVGLPLRDDGRVEVSEAVSDAAGGGFERVLRGQRLQEHGPLSVWL